MADKSADASPGIKIKFEPNAQSLTGDMDVIIDGHKVGSLSRPTHAPKSFKGYFLRLDGVTWNNSPGARQTADSGYFDATMVTSLKQAKERILQHYVDAAKALAKQ